MASGVCHDLDVIPVVAVPFAAPRSVPRRHPSGLATTFISSARCSHQTRAADCPD